MLLASPGNSLGPKKQMRKHLISSHPNQHKVMTLTFERKLLRVMRLTSVILLTCCIHVAAKTSSQTVTYKGTNEPLEKIFKVVENQTGYLFIYNPALLERAHPVTINAEEMPLENFLKNLLTDQQLEYEFNDRTVIIKRKSLKNDLNRQSSSYRPGPPIDIHGKVVDETDRPLASVTVTVKDTKIMTTTDDNGEFFLTVFDKNAILVFSSINMQTFAINIGGRTEDIIVKLKTRLSQLDEVQVIPYGQTTRRLQTGNVSTVNAADIAKQPINNPLLALQGSVPGVFVVQNTGIPGGGVNVLIRGQNSISNGRDPLYIIDGVPYLSQLPPNIGGDILQHSNNNLIQGGNPLNFISPSDIESISVLKDADATAIYGSRGANGVILINTKKGKRGETKIDVNFSKGIAEVGRSIDLLSTKDYLQMRREAFKNDSVTPDQFNAPDLMNWDTASNKNWQKELIGGTARYTNVQSSLSGGNASTQFFIGGNFHKITTVLPGSSSDERESIHFNITNTSTNQRFKSTLSGVYLSDNSDLPSTDLTNYIYLSPNAPDPLNDDGTLNWANSSWPSGGNPFASVKRRYKVRTNNLISNAVLSYRILDGLEILSSFGYTNMQANEISISPIASWDPAFGMTGSASFTNNSARSWIVEPRLNYHRSIQRSNVEVTVGSTFHQSINDGQILNGTGYTSDALLENSQAAPIINIGSRTSTVYKYNALFGRLNYNWAGKYIVNITARRDGSSRFGKNNRFHNFAGVGTAWIFSQEKLVERNLPFMSFGKLHFSFGTTGSDQIGDYHFYDLFHTNQYTYQGIVGLSPSTLFNPDLAWEETKKFEGGIDLGFFKDRMLLNIAYYRNRCSNQLLRYTLPTVTGFSFIPANFPATVQNDGLEVYLNTTNLKSERFTWTSSINFTKPNNKLVAFPDLASTPYQFSLSIGEPITIAKVFHSIGVNPVTGVYEFTDSKGNSTYVPTYGVDNTVTVNTAPKFYGGLRNSLIYGGFELDFIFQFTKQIGANYLFQRFPTPGSFGTNAAKDVLDRWQKNGDNASIEQFTQSFTSGAFASYLNARQSDLAYTDASYIRLKNLSISYRLSDKNLKTMHLHDVKVYLQCQNLLTITKYKGIDPENNNLTAVPPLRVVTAGVEISL
jgi:TonB-dependent starch-binding outer membrane protein SusC